MTGKWGLGEPKTTGLPNDQGFDEWFGYLNQRRAHSYYVDFLWLNRERYPLPGNAQGQRQQYTHDLMTDFALDFVARYAREPFFLYVPYTIPHDAYEVPTMGLYADKPWTEQERIYAAMVDRMDGDIGRLRALLRELKLEGNTLFFFCSDNGAAKRWPGVFDSSGPLRGKKRDMYEGGIRVPMIVTGPGVPAGRVSDAPWYFADLLPTLADLVHVETPVGVDGVSVLPLLRGESQDLSQRLLYWEFYEGGFKQAARRGPWKAVRPAPGKPLELYDLRVDLGEQNDLALRKPQLVAEFAASIKAARVTSPHWPAPVDRVAPERKP
jgi:arylsulfatase A-like enzyme